MRADNLLVFGRFRASFGERSANGDSAGASQPPGSLAVLKLGLAGGPSTGKRSAKGDSRERVGDGGSRGVIEEPGGV